MLAAFLEWPFALRKARRVSTRVDLTAGSESLGHPVAYQNVLSQQVLLELRRTAGSDLLGTDPSALETMTLPVAVERSKSPWHLETERSSAKLEGPSWMAGTRTGGASSCPMASVHSALGSIYGDTNLMSRLLGNVANKSTCGSPHLANMGLRRSMAIVHSVVSVWPILDRESAWMLCIPGRWTGTNVAPLEQSYGHLHQSVRSRAPLVLDVSHSHCVVAHQANHPGPQMRQEVSHSVDDGLHLQSVDVPRCRLWA